MLISEETLNQLLKFYPEDKQKLIKSQMKVLENFIIKNRKEYSNNPEYSKAIDSILTLIMKGELVGDK